MKQKIAIVTGLLILLLFSCTLRSGEDTETFVADAEYIQIVLFHLAQRCESCNAVERETIALLENEYGEALASGNVKFISLSVQSANGKKAARILQAAGQSLFVVYGDSVADLTGSAFIYASIRPEIYRDALRKALDFSLE
jgi:hypothetical protein